MDSLPNNIADTLAQLLPDAVSHCSLSIAAAHIDRIPERLLPENAVNKRLQEFATGRVAAATALEQAGIPDWYAGIGEAGQPVWPANFTGSITHDLEIAAAAVAPTARLSSIGLDIELLQLPDAPVRRQIMRPEEEVLWAALVNQDATTALMTVFSFKEAVFKCVYPLTGIFLDFQDVIIAPPDKAPRARCAASGHAANAVLERVEGRVALCAGRVISACWIPDQPPTDRYHLKPARG